MDETDDNCAKPWRGPAAIILLIGFVVLLWLSVSGQTKSPKLATAYLHDGRVLTLAAATFGTNHVFVGKPVSWWEKLWPQRESRASIAPTIKTATRSPQLLLWFEVKSPNSSDTPTDLKFVWESGESVGKLPATQDMEHQNWRWFHSATSIWPRHEEFLNVQGKLNGEPFTVQIANPARVTPAKSLPQTLPATNKVLGYDFVLHQQ